MNAVMQIVQTDRSFAIYIICYVRWTLRDHGIFSSRKINGFSYANFKRQNVN